MQPVQWSTWAQVASVREQDEKILTVNMNVQKY